MNMNDHLNNQWLDRLDADIAAKPAPPTYRLLKSGDIHAMPPLTWRVKGVMPSQGLAAIYGPSASGKSFLAFDMASAIASGQRWFGHRVEQAPVVYVGLEGEAGFRTRTLAWEAHRGHALPDNMALVLQPFCLTEAQDVTAMAAVVPAGAVVFVDTLARATPASDENSAADMALVLDACKKLQDMTGGLVCMVHHSGKDSARGMRGSTSLFAAMDAVVEVTRSGDHRDWRVAKSKDGADGAGKSFALEVIHLGQDEHEDPITSCVVRPSDEPIKDKTKPARLSTVQAAVMDFLADQPAGIRTSAVVNHIKDNHSRSAIYTAIERLEKMGLVHLAHQSGLICIAENQR